MTVSELLDLLKDCPPKANVWVQLENGTMVYDIAVVSDGHVVKIVEA